MYMPACLVDAVLRILFGRDSHRFSKGLEESTVIGEAACFISIHDSGAIT